MPVEEITTTDVGDKEFWAKWTANTYELYFYPNPPEPGLEVIYVQEPIDVTYDRVLPPVMVPICEGYEFQGYFYDPSIQPAEPKEEDKAVSLRSSNLTEDSTSDISTSEIQYYKADGQPVEDMVWDIPKNSTLSAHWSKVPEEPVAPDDTPATGDRELPFALGALALVSLAGFFAIRRKFE